MTPDRLACLLHYGRQCECCGARRLEHLELHHVGGGGNQHRRQLYPWKLEHRLARAGYPCEIDGYRIQILCQRCHRSASRSGEGHCMLDHTDDVLAEEAVSHQRDPSLHADMPTRLVRGSGKRQPAEATVMLSIRVKPELKARFEAHADHGMRTNAEVLEYLLDTVERGERQRHQEVMDALARLATQQDEVLARLDDRADAYVPPDGAALTPADDPFAHRDPQTWYQADEAPSDEPLPPSPRRWWRR